MTKTINSWLFVFGVGIFTYLVLTSCTMPTPPPVPEGRDPKLWNRGRLVYQGRCTSCHNSNPDLAGAVGPKLRGVSETLLVDRLTNGKAAMPAQKNLLRFAPALHEYLR